MIERESTWQALRHTAFFSAVFLAFLVGVVGSAPPATQPRGQHPLPALSRPQLTTAERAAVASTRLPFVENRGQFTYEGAAYVADVLSGNVSVAPGEISYHFGETTFSERFDSGSLLPGSTAPTQVSYFLGNDNTKWQSGLPSYDAVRFADIAPGASMELQVKQGTVEKVITLAPGADPAAIRFNVSQDAELSVRDDGALEVLVGAARSSFSPPVAWQDVAGSRRPVAVAYAPHGSSYGFTLGDYDHGQPLLIDPIFDTLVGSTYVGGIGIGSGNDSGFAVKRKSNGQIVTAGMLKGPGLATSGAYDESVNGGTEAFIALYSNDLSSLIALTYIGGSETDFVNGIDVDASGNVYVVGTTRSPNFPTTAGADSTFGGDPATEFDLFVLKMNSTLTSLTASTYFGGDEGDSGATGVLDDSGNFWVLGNSASPDFPLPNGGSEYDRTHNGDYDGIISRWDSNLATSTLTTFVGGSGWDNAGTDINFDSSGNVWISGTSWSDDFPTTVGAYDTTGDVTNGDIVIFKLNSTLSSLVASTYFGGTGEEGVFGSNAGVQFDSAGQVVVAGYTTTTDIPATAGAYDTTHNGGADGVIFKMDTGLTAISALTYLGGSGTDYLLGIYLVSDKIIGTFFSSASTNLPVTVGAMDSTRSDASDPAFFRMSADLTTLDQLSYFMNTESEPGEFEGIGDFDYSDGVLVISGTTSGGLPLTDNSYDTTYAGSTDAYVAVISSSADPAAPAAGHTPTYEEINPPYAPTPLTPEALSTSSIRWNFQDRSAAEGGFRIVDAVAGTIYATSEPVATQNLTSLDETGLSPGTTYCNRAAVAVGGNGVSAVTAQNTFSCFATLPNVPGPLTVTGRFNTELRFNNHFTQDTGNGAEVLFGIRELTSGKWVTPVAASGSNPYVLDDARYLDMVGQWPESITLTMLTPGTAYQFVPVTSMAGATVVDGGTVGASTVSQAPVLSVTLTAQVFSLGGALAAIGLMSNIATPFFVGGVLLLTAVFVWSNRRAGRLALAHSLWDVAASSRPTMTYNQYFLQRKETISYVAYRAWHRRLRRAMQGAGVAVGLKGLVLVLALGSAFVPGQVGASTTAGLGDRVQYTVRVENTGAGDATNVVLMNTLPAGAAYAPNALQVAGQAVTDAADGDAGTLATGTFQLTLATLPAGGLATFGFELMLSGQDATGGAVTVVLTQACVTAAEVSQPACSNVEDTTVASAPTNSNENSNTNTPEPEVNSNVNEPVTEPEAPPVPEEPPIVPEPSRSPEAALHLPPSLLAAEGLLAPARQTTITVNGKPAAEPTSDSTPDIGGSAAPRTLVQVSLAGESIGTVRTNAAGQFNLTVPNTLVDGVYRVVVRQAGNEVDAADITVDTVAPRLPLGFTVQFPSLFSAPDETGSVTLRLSADLPPDVARVDLRVESEPQFFTFTPTGGFWKEEVAVALEPGEHSASVRAVDWAGNASPEVRRIFTVAAPSVLSNAFAAVSDAAAQPAVQETARVGVPVLAVATTAGALATAGVALPIIQFFGLLFTQPVLLFYRRRRSGYGVIYNVLTKMPVDLAVVRLKDPVSGRAVQTKVTDRAGRYLFSAPPGIYTLEVQKNGFHHPTQFLRTSKDAVFADVSIASRVTVGPDGRFGRNIPVDPEQHAVSPARLAFGQWARQLQAVVAVAGPVVSLGATFLAPTRTNMILAGVQVALFGAVFLAAQRRARRGFGVVIDGQTGKPVAGAVVRVFESTYNRLLETQVTDSHGRYGFLVGPNNYIVDVQKQGFRPYRSSELDLHRVAAGALLGPDVRLAHGVAKPQGVG